MTAAPRERLDQSARAAPLRNGRTRRALKTLARDGRLETAGARAARRVASPAKTRGGPEKDIKKARSVAPTTIKISIATAPTAAPSDGVTTPRERPPIVKRSAGRRTTMRDA